jgi:hypothetical protein
MDYLLSGGGHGGLFCASNNVESAREKREKVSMGAQPSESYYDYPISRSGKLFHSRDPEQRRRQKFSHSLVKSFPTNSKKAINDKRH